MFLSNVFHLPALSTLLAVAYAQSGCRCGDSEFLAIPHVNLSTTEQMKTCSSYKMLDARGTGEPQGVSLMFQLAIQRVLESNVSAVSQSVEYPAGVDQNFTSGAQNVADTIYNGLQDCPDQKYFLLGYSQGASLVQEAFKKLDERSVAAINSVIMVGNPYRIPGRLSNVDSQGRHDNRTVYGLFATMALQSNDSILTYNEDLDRSGKVSDICLENDIVCASDPQCDCQLASDHISYGQMKSVQDLIYNLIMSRV